VTPSPHLVHTKVPDYKKVHLCSLDGYLLQPSSIRSRS
jgi:hypothetical protein